MIKNISIVEKLEITIKPSQKDLYLKTLTDIDIFDVQLPAEFLMGENWIAKFYCKKCNHLILFGYGLSNFKKLTFLSNYDINDIEFLDHISSPFANIKLKEWYSERGNFIHNYYFNEHNLAKIFMTYCNDCDATYLGCFGEAHGGECERSPADMSPDYVFINELVFVDIDRLKFIDEFNRKKR